MATLGSGRKDTGHHRGLTCHAFSSSVLALLWSRIKVKRCFLSEELTGFFWRVVGRASSERLRIVYPQREGTCVNRNYAFPGGLWNWRQAQLHWSALRALEPWMHMIERLPGENCWAFILLPVLGQEAKALQLFSWKLAERTMLSSVKGWLPVPPRWKELADLIWPFCLAPARCFPAL